ncbi:PKD domain-containing protein [Poritiphilus flavus]|uniref:PKD domain-containing protein n=1 Tax=Poritiphilus flavus TaxID=2697053 RepID=A0A6L9ECP2_9FLAO|nr:malectin domain-containing carbohydrate-binding protein [Poritiphilus flavus]NAS12381.1 PKD domain-containing protein [Poritiphilus flavus]
MRKLYPKTYLSFAIVTPLFLLFKKNLRELSLLNTRGLRSGLFSLLLLALFTSGSIHAQLPDEFQKVDLVTGLANATTFKFAPDGRIFIIDRYGEVIIYKPDTQSTVSAGTLPVFHEFEDGLLGIAFDPDFSTNNYIYLHYSPLAASVNRVSQFTMNGDVLDISSEVVMIEWTTQRTCCFHSGGDLDFDSQGNLYIATGDNTNHSPYATFDENNPTESSENTSSNMNDLRGKILRITPQSNGSYTIPAGNLFPGGVDGLPEIYVMGARNPYRIFVDKENTDWLFWGEVGPDADVPGGSGEGPVGLDEINLTKAAGNYGWPYFSGDNEAYLVDYASTPYYNNPASPQNISVWNTGGTDLPPAQPAWLDFFHQCYLSGPRYYYDASLTDLKRLPVEFDGVYFYFDFNTSKIWAVTMDATGNIITNEQLAPSVFPTSQDGFLDMKIGPDGFMYILAYGTGCCPQNAGTGRLIRVDYIGITTNSIPVVTLDASPTDGILDLEVNFSSDGTFDPDGDSPLSYAWDFTTDGIIDSTDPNPTFTYTTEGTFNAQLRVDDGNGGIGVKNVTIYAGNTKATFDFTSPVDGGLIGWGDDVDIDLEVTDEQDGSTSGGEIDCDDVNVVPSLGHLNHFHDEATLNGCPQTVTLGYEGHQIGGEADLFFVLGTNYTDTGGLISFDQIRLHPKRKEAEFADSESGTVLISNTDPWGGGNSAMRVDNDGYIVFEGRNLANITGVKYRVASTMAGGSIELRLGSPTGTLVVATNVPNTGGNSNWLDVESNLTNPGGKNDLYFVFKNGGVTSDIFDLNYVEFLGNGVSTDNTPPEVVSVVAEDNNTIRVDFSEYVSQATAENLSNYSIDGGISVNAVALQENDQSVLITTSNLSSGVTYNLTISNVQNLVGLPVVSDSYSFFIFNAVRINAGGPEVTADGETFVADQYFNGGDTYTDAIPIENTDADQLYQSERYSTFSYEIPIPVAGEYDIRLHFAEIFLGVPSGNPGGGAGDRVFNVAIEGEEVLVNFDILTETDPATALIKTFDNFSITDGTANIQFTPGVDNPKISAIEILPPDTFQATPDITIISPSNGWDVNQPFEVNFTVENWEIAVGSTHMHYFIDGVMVGPHYSYGPITIDGLSLGNHTIRLELFDASHVGTGVFDEITVNVTAQLTCNDNPFPDQWVVHEIEDFELPYRAVYIFPHYDLDGDGLKDIVTGGWWYKNPGSASGNWQQNAIGSPFNNVAHVYDFDGDGDMDLLGTQGAYESSDMAWAENDGSGNFTVRTNIPSGTATFGEPFLAGLAGGVFQTAGPYQMAINWNGAEDTGDAMQLLTVPADPVNTTWTLENLSPDSLGEDVNEGDINRDGNLDLFQGGNWLRNNGDGTWTTFSTGATYATTLDRNQLADFDRDGDLDAVVGQLGLGSDPDRFEFAWFEAPADPEQPWTKRVLATDITGSLSVFVEDIDFDGDEDIIVGEWLQDHRLIVFENDLCDSGTFIRQTIDMGGTGFDHHDGAQVVDIDNDGDLDVVSIGWDNIIPRIFENTTAGPSDPIADAGEDQTITLPTNSVVLNGSGNDPDGGTINAYMWTQESGPSTATLSGEATADLIADDLIEGVYVFRLTVTDDESATGFDDVTVNVVPPTDAIRINAGGPAYTFNGLDWSADQYFSGGDTFANAMEIANTSNDQLYHTERFTTSSSFSYEIPVTDGTYDLNLHFAEVFYGVPNGDPSGGAGSRVFNVDIEGGQAQLMNYDIFVAAGGPSTAVVENFTGINVNDGALTITLSAIVEFPKITGIEVLGESGTQPPVADAGEDQTVNLPNSSIVLDGSGYDPDGGSITAYQWAQVSGPTTATLGDANTDNLTASDLVEGTYVFSLTVTDDEAEMGTDQVTVEVLQGALSLRINSGGPALTFMGEDWSADQYFLGGGVFSDPIAIANTENDELYQTERFNTSGILTYEIPVASGDYNINLHFAEIFFGVPSGDPTGGEGSRIFDIDIEGGQQTMDNYDIVAAAGGSATAVIETFSNITVNDGSLTIILTSVVENPKISGIEVFGSGAPIADAGPDQTLTLPTNQIMLSGSGFDPDGGDITAYLWTQESGPSTATLAGETTTDVTVSDLVAGTYTFRLTVTDDENDTGFDEVIVTVQPEGGGEPPVADAGADQTIVLPTNSVTLNGSGTDPDGGDITAYLWTQESGPGTATLSGETTATLTASDLVEGVYVFRLTVTDDESQTGFDEVTVTVLPEGSNLPPVAVINADPTSGNAPLQVTFSAANSTDDMGIVSYLWEFGDGSTSTDMEASYTFNNPGTYEVTLTVEDAAGLTNSATVTITVEAVADKMKAILELNPTQQGVARVQILNQPGDTEIFGVRIYDVGGRLVSSYLGEELQTIQGAYIIPVDTHRNGVYFLRLIMSEGEPFLLKMVIRN